MQGCQCPLTGHWLSNARWMVRQIYSINTVALFCRTGLSPFKCVSQGKSHLYVITKQLLLSTLSADTNLHKKVKAHSFTESYSVAIYQDTVHGQNLLRSVINFPSFTKREFCLLALQHRPTQHILTGTFSYGTYVHLPQQLLHRNVF